MVKEYIERGKVLKDGRWNSMILFNDTERAREIILCQPAADVVEVVHGRWIMPTKIGHRSFDIPHCSACDGVPCGVDENTNYCPNCGAKMDGGTENE